MAKITDDDMLQFCREKEHECRKLELARREMARSWRSGSDEEWRSMALTMRAPFISHKKRKARSESDDRIAERCFKEAEMYSAIAEYIERRVSA